MSREIVLAGLGVGDWHRQAVDPEAALDRLRARVEREEPRIHALVPEAGRFTRLRQALDEAPSGPLERVPIGIKDIFHVEGLPTQAGSRLPAAELRGAQATSVRALQQAGAVILGKTVTTEFAYFAAGPTRNPHDIQHTPGGSSSGSAAAVAAGYCPLALGTQTIGSISRPASYCGVVGYKPTHGRISLAGVIPLAPSLDHVGVFATNVADAQTAASVLCGAWTSIGVERRPVLGIPRGPYLSRASTEGIARFERLCTGLRSLGWEIQAVDLFANFERIEERNQLILAAEVARVHQDWFRRFGDLYHAKTRALIEQGQQISQTTLAAALDEQRVYRERLERQTEEAGVDLWISPAATGTAPRGIESTGDPVMSLPWSQAGVPTLALPAGVGGSGLPIGLQVAARWSEDESLLAWGRELATALGELG